MDNKIDNRTTQQLIKLYAAEKIAILQSLPFDVIEEAVDEVWRAYQKGRTIYACGNGGNAAYVGNLIVDLANHPFVSDDKTKPLPSAIPRLSAYNLCADSASITGIMNDMGPDAIFSQQLINHRVSQGDLIFGFTGSGNSPNILRAFEIGRQHGARSIAITRGNGGKAKTLADLCIIIPGTSTFPGQIGGNDNNFHYEDMTSEVAHMITGIMRQRITQRYNGS